MRYAPIIHHSSRPVGRQSLADSRMAAWECRPTFSLCHWKRSGVRGSFMRPHRNPKKFNAGFRARPAGDFPVYSAHPWASPCGPAFGSSNLFQTNLSAKVTKTIPPERGPPKRRLPCALPSLRSLADRLSCCAILLRRKAQGARPYAPARSGASRPWSDGASADLLSAPLRA